MQPAPPASVVEAAESLDYRDYLTVVLVVDRAEVFPDNGIYIHEPDVALGRIQNYKNWSPHMVPDPRQTALGIRESSSIGLVQTDEVVDGTVVRMAKAYPVYDEHYKANVATIRGWLTEAAGNLQTVGRNGMHKYNNQDHSMLSALLAAKNILGEHWDPWKVNTDAEYHEEIREDADVAGRAVPGHVAPLPNR